MQTSAKISLKTVRNSKRIYGSRQNFIVMLRVTIQQTYFIFSNVEYIIESNGLKPIL